MIRPARMRLPRAAVAPLLALGLVVLSGATGCGSRSPEIATVSGGYSADNGFIAEPGSSVPPPTSPLPTARGGSVALRDTPPGSVTLVYFGYTSCPDVCPTTMADLAVAKRKLPAAEQARVRVVMVSTDPHRDTDAALTGWLSQFDPAFVGVREPIGEVVDLAGRYGIGITPPSVGPGDYQVTHGGQVVVLGAGGIQLGYFQTSTDVPGYVAELQTLLSRSPAPSSPSEAEGAPLTFGGGGTEHASSAFAVSSVRTGTDEETAAYLDLTSTGTTDDALTGASSPEADQVMLHDTTSSGNGAMTMTMVDRIRVPARGNVSLHPDGPHLMITGLHHPLRAGDRLPLVVDFSSGARISLDLPVLDRTSVGGGS